MQQTNTMPGYTGFKPSEEVFVSPAMKKELQGNQAGSYKVPGKFLGTGITILGYAGYVPGVKSENVFGESFGKTSLLANNGQI
jgi:hypothetical protein